MTGPASMIPSNTAAHLSWLAPFVKTKFHGPCPMHGVSKCYLLNYYCTNCMGTPFCYQCYKEDIKHSDHLILQVRRASGHSAIEVGDINKLLDVSSIKEFNINKKKIFHLYSRQTKKHTGLSLKGCCKTCNWELKTDDLFCSIECKLVASQEEEMELVASQEEEMDEIRCASASMTPEEIELPRSKRPCIHNTSNKLHNQQTIKRDVVLEAESCSKSLRQRSRKGIPHRSPFY